MKNQFLCALCVLCGLNLIATPLQWTCDWPEAKSQTFSLYQGETATFEPTFRVNGQLITNATIAAVWYQTNGMGNAWWKLDGNTFAPSNDVGAAAYRFFVEAQAPSSKLYRANGALRMLPSPGFTPNTLPLPVATLDFAQITVLNPPWSDVSADLTPATNYTDSATNAVLSAANAYTDAAIADLPPPAETDPHFREWVASVTNEQGIISAAETAMFVYTLGSPASEVGYSAEDITAATNSSRQAVDAAARAATNYTDEAIGDISFPVRSVNSKTGAVTLAASDVGAYSATDGQTLAGQVTAIGAHANGEDAKVMVTNYNSSTHLPEAEIDINVSNNWLVVWREMTRWNWFIGDLWNPFTNSVSSALANKAEKEYAFYDGVTGEPAPDGFFWISQPRVAICAGAAYQRYVDTAGEVWVLESNGMVADINGTTNGYFRISDDRNNVQFEIVKGNSRTVVAAPGAMTRSSVMGVTHWHTTYMVTNAVSAPKAMFCRDLANPEWYAEDAAGCPCNVAWTHPAERIYVCEWWPQGNEPAMFMRSQYGQGSESRIIQNAPVEMQYIVIGGVKYALGTATIDGKTVLTLSAP